MPNITEDINISLNSCEGCEDIIVIFGAVIAYEI